MRINEYNSLAEFTNEYIGEWSPSDGHWLGLDFAYSGKRYRLHTVLCIMHKYSLPNGKEARLG